MVELTFIVCASALAFIICFALYINWVVWIKGNDPKETSNFGVTSSEEEIREHKNSAQVSVIASQGTQLPDYDSFMLANSNGKRGNCDCILVMEETYCAPPTYEESLSLAMKKHGKT
ncbi:uncharacterized protein LOC110846589 [Folsomia candida]|uniref:Uncharacterized protein n=1 Tax=Folsomia candida TaxID=158441 RepID=A0A226EYR2_FOLCA|nr:uncharacterized protein LOC110846589 [Folsomia candida]OXA62669.1 hypothetical protein Fcan01_01124 [Folsomia candida]